MQLENEQVQRKTQYLVQHFISFSLKRKNNIWEERLGNFR